MHVAVFAPSARLARFVDCFRIAELDAPVTRALLPELGLALAIHFDGASRLIAGDSISPLPSVVLTGVQGSVRRMQSVAHTRIAIATFRPGAASAFFGMPLHELRGQSVAFEGAGSLADQLADATSNVQRIAIFEDFLLARLEGSPDPVALAAVHQIEAAHGSIRIDVLAKSLGISQDPLEKRFRRTVGTSPKQLASLIRVRRALELAHRGTAWSRVAQQVGYYDQSHFIHEFRSVTGATPARFVRDRQQEHAGCGPVRR